MFASLNEMMPNELFKKLSEAKLAPQKDVIAHYNAWQVQVYEFMDASA
jgi:hypothetical protein